MHHAKANERRPQWRAVPDHHVAIIERKFQRVNSGFTPAAAWALPNRAVAVTTSEQPNGCELRYL